eukprot:3110014-Pyramimonas_sp.AAC.1
MAPAIVAIFRSPGSVCRCCRGRAELSPRMAESPYTFALLLAFGHAHVMNVASLAVAILVGIAVHGY